MSCLQERMELDDLRKKINKIDEKLLIILARRFSLTRKIGKYKATRKMKIFDEKREEQVLAEWKKMAGALYLDNIFAEKILKIIMSQAKKEQRQ